MDITLVFANIRNTRNININNTLLTLIAIKGIEKIKEHDYLPNELKYNMPTLHVNISMADI